MVLVDFSHIL